MTVCGIWFPSGYLPSQTSGKGQWYVHIKYGKTTGPYTLDELKEATGGKYLVGLMIRKGNNGRLVEWTQMELVYPELADAGLVPGITEQCPFCGKKVENNKCQSCKYVVGSTCPKCNSSQWNGNRCYECNLDIWVRRTQRLAGAIIAVVECR